MRQQLLDVLNLLDTAPAPRGRERTAAHRLRTWCARRWPHVEWQVLEHGPAGGSLVAAHGAGPLLYSHLDTSLDDGGAHNHLVTGNDALIAPLAVDGDVVAGFGGVNVVTDRMSAPYLKGASIDFVDTIEKQGFTIDNPNATGSCACGDSFS